MDLEREMQRLVQGYTGPRPRLYVGELRLAPGDDQVDLSVSMEVERALEMPGKDIEYAAQISGTKRIWLEMDREPPRVWCSGPTIDVGLPQSFGDVREVEVRNGRLVRACVCPADPVSALDELHPPALIHWLLSRLLHLGGLGITLHISLPDLKLDGIDVGNYGLDGRLSRSLATVAEMTSVDTAKMVAVACWPTSGRGRKVSHLKIKNAGPRPYVKAYVEQEVL